MMCAYYIIYVQIENRGNRTKPCNNIGNIITEQYNTIVTSSNKT